MYVARRAAFVNHQDEWLHQSFIKTSEFDQEGSGRAGLNSLEKTRTLLLLHHWPLLPAHFHQFQNNGLGYLMIDRVAQSSLNRPVFRMNKMHGSSVAFSSGISGRQEQLPVE